MGFTVQTSDGKDTQSFSHKNKTFFVSKTPKCPRATLTSTSTTTMTKTRPCTAGDPASSRSKLEAAQHTNQHNPAGHERKIATKLMNAEKNKKEAGKGHPIS